MYAYITLLYMALLYNYIQCYITNVRQCPPTLPDYIYNYVYIYTYVREAAAQAQIALCYSKK